MIVVKNLLSDLKKRVKELSADLDGRLRLAPLEQDELLRQHRLAVSGGRCGANFTDWRHEKITQAAVAWVLSTCFIRFLEDNDLLASRKLADPDHTKRAEDHLRLFFRDRPEADERHYLLAVIEEVAALPAAAALFDVKHNPLFSLQLSGDGAANLLAFWRKRDDLSGALIHNFADPQWDTRFLGDLYQDLSDDIRKNYALLQTPEFVESFILDHTLTPAIDTFGYEKLRLIDPTCGSGHFLLGAFQRLLALYLHHQPARDIFDLTQSALNSVYGVDLNPYAVAIARFRLVIAAFQACQVTALTNAPMFKLNLAAGDSLLHGKAVRENIGRQEELFEEHDRYKHVYDVEDRDALKAILDQTYHVVVGNPPYIVCRDKVLNEAYRQRYTSTHRQYSLGVPFTERFFLLALDGFADNPSGYVGLITANSFMKREFGTKLIGSFFPQVELTHVIDTSGAYIPGHGTPTVILFGRNRPVVAKERAFHKVRALLGIRGEPSTPADPAQGLVWSSLVSMIGQQDAENEFISVSDKNQTDFHQHPWSLTGGGANLVKAQVEHKTVTLDMVSSEIGFICMTRCDDVYFTPRSALLRVGVKNEFIVENVEGTVVRDWGVNHPNTTLFPYNKDLKPVSKNEGEFVHRFLWPHRTHLWLRREPNGNHRELGLTWWEWSRFQRSRYLAPSKIAFAFVATHNHFVLDRGGKVFKQSAPVIKLPEGASEDDHLALLGLLNSSTACFWMKQMFYPKGGDQMGSDGARVSKHPWEDRYEFDGTKLKAFPLTANRPFTGAKILDDLVQGNNQFALELVFKTNLPSNILLRSLEYETATRLKQMVFHQEELDWQCYQLYGLLKDTLSYTEDPVPIEPGERAFEIALARQMAAGITDTIWFKRHHILPLTELPAHWPESYRQIVERRLEAITINKNIRLIEKPEFKRRWVRTPFAEQSQAALSNWLLERLEKASFWQTQHLCSIAQLADLMRLDHDFMSVAALYKDRPDFDLTDLLADLIAKEHVPALAACRYQGKGLDNFAAWKRTWELQRLEDAIDARTSLPVEDPQHLSAEAAAALKMQQVGDIPVPPKYKPADFQGADYFRLRGKLDVPKERFISFPHCERDGDSSLVIGWAGWDHLQRTQAIAEYFLDCKESQGWSGERLLPLLAALEEQLPWVKQWHNAYRVDVATRMGDYFEGFLAEELRDLGFTHLDLQAWTAPKNSAKKRAKKAKVKK